MLAALIGSKPPLVRRADKQEVGGDRVAEELLGERERVEDVLWR
jgi:hypothetical protein